MSNTVNIDWSQPIEIEGVYYCEDSLFRQKYAQYLSRFLASKGYDELRPEQDKKQNYVLNLNSEWGTGKTYFLRRWAESLKNYHPVVYVDAWKQDYSDDPLMSVIASMINQLREQAGKSAEDSKFKASRKVLGLLKATAPAITGSLVKRYIGIDPLTILNSDDNKLVGKEIKDENGNPIDMGTAATRLVTHLIDEHSKKSVAITSLKTNIEQWISAVQGNQANNTYRQLPAFVFIDELDRCRPSYAVEMLETIKHIFDIRGVVFVVATDTNQLQHAVKSIYGAGFDADLYLGRFFDARYTLKQIPYNHLLSIHCDMNSFSSTALKSNSISTWPNCDTPQEEIDNIATIYSVFGLSAREAIQTTERLISTVRNLETDKTINLYYLLILMCLSNKKRSYYERLKKVSLKNRNYNDSLLHLLDKELNWYGCKLSLRVEPKTYFKRLSEPGNSISSTYNKYEDGTYNVDIRDLFSECHDAYQDRLIDDEPYKKAIDSLLVQLNANYPNINWQSKTQAEINQWVTVIAFKLSSQNSYRFGEYKDLVELSTALDA
ncbi:NTPase KAP [Vibrio parahaemolyticus]|uniref:KAP family P-loop NTPase fold protein n=1 Tax=Vibrio parahaemolyticus TaxID=670 RepID=UPI00186A4B26|nr:P-loop NTPase fold protein [Vibrio parahaemolyticus]MBE3841137.1 NTPase KAP [Vibrio parahaemolyticus]MBE4776688.1 NTPase KAP [Vibrio parahaemolyticus]